jgi:Tol biopolymer transport system component
VEERTSGCAIATSPFIAIGRRACFFASRPQQEQLVRKAFAVAVVMSLAVQVPRGNAQAGAAGKPEFGTPIATSDSLGLSGDESPDGRWILFSSAVRNGPAHLWVMPATGGVPHRLTDGAYDDDYPVWFPSGRRIAFHSSRVHAIMSADFDPVGGRIVGPLKRVTVDEAGMWFDVSSDGKQIVYQDRNRVRVMPASGGTAKTILDNSAPASGLLFMPRFSPDGRQVFVSHRKPGTNAGRLLRVPVDGGPVTTVLDGPPDGLPWSIVAEPMKDRVTVYSQRSTAILTMRGDTIATMPNTAMSIGVFSRDGRRLLKNVDVGSSVVRLVPTSGGKPIDVTPGNGYDYPFAWSAEGKQIFSFLGDSTSARTKAGAMVSDIASGARRFVPFAPLDTGLTWSSWLPWATSGDGRFWALRPRSSSATFSLVLYDTETRRSRQLSSAAAVIFPNQQGANGGGREFYYVERNELRAVSGQGEPRALLASARLHKPWLVAVHGDRVALGEIKGDSTVLYVAHAGGQEQQLTTIAGHAREIRWSSNGAMLAATVRAPGSAAAPNFNVVFLTLGQGDVLARPPRFVRTDEGWDLAWLPDGRAVTILENQGRADHTRVLRVPVDAEQQPTSLTPNERGAFWDQYLSPDGRYVAIPVERLGRSTLWSIDIDAAAKAWREKKGQPSPRQGAH